MIQDRVIKYVLRPFGNITKNMQDKTRERWVVLCIFFLTALPMLFSSTILPVRYLVLFVLSCLFLGAIIVLGISPDIKPVKLDKIAVFCWVVVTAFIGVNGLFVNTDDLSEFALWAVALPIVFMVWGNQPERLFRCVTKGVCWSFWLYFAVSMFFFPITGGRYASFWGNTNSAAMYLTAVLVCMMVKLIASNKKGSILLCCLGIGTTAALIYYSNSRGGMIAVGVSAAITLVIWLLQEQNRVGALLKIAGAVIMAFVMIFATVYISSSAVQLKQYVSDLVTPTQNMQDPTEGSTGTEAPTDGSETPTDGTEAPTDGSEAPTEDSETPTEDSETPTEDSVPERTEPPTTQTKPNDVLGNIGSIHTDRNNQDSSTLNSFTTGRVDIWKAYGKEVGWLGHGPEDVVYKADGRVEARSSHLTQLQFAYQYGLLAGIFFLLLNCWSGVKAIWYVFANKEKSYRFFVLAVVLAYGAYSVIEANITTFGRMIIILYFFALTPLMLKKENKK